MEEMTQYLNEVSLLGPTTLGLLLILFVNLGLTLIHSIQELKGQLWRYFGAIAGVRIPDALGFLIFFLGLTIILWIMGFIGISGNLVILEIPKSFAIGALGFMIGARFSDRLYSHIRLDRKGYKPNPGLKSTPFYLAEAVILAVIFSPGLISHYIAAAVGLIIGWLLFFIVLPVLRLLRIFPSLHRESWKPGEDMPS